MAVTIICWILRNLYAIIIIYLENHLACTRFELNVDHISLLFSSCLFYSWRQASFRLRICIIRCFLSFANVFPRSLTIVYKVKVQYQLSHMVFPMTDTLRQLNPRLTFYSMNPGIQIHNTPPIYKNLLTLHPVRPSFEDGSQIRV